jgi:hypothetical protein
VNLTDSYEFKQAPSSLILSLMTPCHVDIATPGSVLLSEATLVNGRVSASGKITYDSRHFTVSTEVIPINDDHLGSTWGQRVTRILFNSNDPGKKGRWVIQIKGEV